MKMGLFTFVQLLPDSVQAFLLFEGPGESLATPLMPSGTIQAIAMKLCTVIALLKVSSQSRKSEFRVFSIVHLNIYNF